MWFLNLFTETTKDLSDANNKVRDLNTKLAGIHAAMICYFFLNFSVIIIGNWQVPHRRWRKRQTNWLTQDPNWKLWNRICGVWYNFIHPHLIVIKFNSVGWFSFTVTTQDLVDTKQDLAHIKAELMKKLDGKCIIRALLYNYLCVYVICDAQSGTNSWLTTTTKDLADTKTIVDGLTTKLDGKC